MKIKALKNLQLITVLLFILTILTLIIGLWIIGLFHGKEVVISKNISLHKILKKIFKYNGFILWSKYSLYYILSNNNISLKNFGNYYTVHNYYHYSLLQFKIGIIFCEILVPILIFITILLILWIIYLKIKIKNKNFWDFIANCEIINNYYIH